MQAESKLRAMESQKNKLEQQLAGKNIATNRKLKTFTRQTEKVGRLDWTNALTESSYIDSTDALTENSCIDSTDALTESSCIDSTD